MYLYLTECQTRNACIKTEKSKTDNRQATGHRAIQSDRKTDKSVGKSSANFNVFVFDFQPPSPSLSLSLLPLELILLQNWHSHNQLFTNTRRHVLHILCIAAQSENVKIGNAVNAFKMCRQLPPQPQIRPSPGLYMYVCPASARPFRVIIDIFATIVLQQFNGSFTLASEISLNSF